MQGGVCFEDGKKAEAEKEGEAEEAGEELFCEGPEKRRVIKGEGKANGGSAYKGCGERVSGKAASIEGGDKANNKRDKDIKKTAIKKSGEFTPHRHGRAFSQF